MASTQHQLLANNGAVVEDITSMMI